MGLAFEHLEISLIAIFIAIIFGGVVGILISEYQRYAKPALGLINFLYTIPSISMLGFLIPFSGIGNRSDRIRAAPDGAKYAYGNEQH